MATINVKLKNGQTVPMSHPDDWSQEQIESAIHESFPDEGANDSQIAPTPFNQQQDEPEQAPEPEKQSKGMLPEMIEHFGNALKAGSAWAGRVPGNIRGIKEEFKKDPIGEFNHMVEQTGVSLAEAGKDFANIALLPLRDPLVEKLTQGKVKLQIPEDTGLQKALRLDSNKKGDELIKDLPGILTTASLAKSLVKKGFAKLDKPFPLGKEAKYRNAKTEEIIKSEKIEKKLKEDFEEYKKQTTRDYGKKNKGEEIGTLDPVSQENAALRKKAKIEDELKPLASIPEKKVGEIPSPEVATKQADDIIAKSKAAVEDAKKNVETELDASEEHVKRAGSAIKPHAEKVKSTASNLYNAVRKNYADAKISIDNSAEIKAVTSDLNKLKEADELAPGYGHGSPEQMALEEKIKALKGEKVAAADVFDVQRSLDQMATQIRNQMRKGGLTDLEFKHLNNKATSYERHASQLEKVLEGVGDANAQKMLKQANEGWRQWKTFQQDALGRKILKSGKIVPKAMYDLTGDEPNNAFINALIKNNPALRKDVLASQYVSKGKVNVNALAKPDKLTESYLKELPKVDKAVNDFKNALIKEKAGKAEAKQVIDKHDALIKAMEKEAEEQAIRIKSAEEIKKLTEQVKLHEQAGIKSEAKIKELEAAGKNTAKLKEDLARHKREYVEMNSHLSKLKKGAIKLGFGKLGYELFFKDNHGRSDN